MYIIAMQNFAALLQPTALAEAESWRQRASNTSNNTMKWLWMEKEQKFRPHLYSIGRVCGDSDGSASYHCWDSTPSPFRNLTGFDEDQVYCTSSGPLCLARRPAVFDCLPCGW
jgi:hypothetical protein